LKTPEIPDIFEKVLNKFKIELGFCSWDRSLGRVRASHGYDSRIGGLPRYFGTDASITSSSSSQLQPPLCLTCSSPLFLVAQIYAPTTGLERNLLVFGCNRGSCYNTSDGVSIPRGTWRVFRSQQDEIPTCTTKTNTNTTNDNEVTVQQLEQLNINENEETNLSEWGIGKEAEGAWGSDSAVESIANSWDITRTEAIKHANAISILVAKKKEAPQSAFPYILSEEEEEADITTFPNCFPAFDIETSLVEYDDEERGGGNGSRRIPVNGEDSSDDDGLFEDEREKQHAKKLLSEYESWAGKVMVVEKEFISNSTEEFDEVEEDMGPIDDTIEDTDEGKESLSPQFPLHRHSSSTSSESLKSSGGGGKGGKELYERLPSKVRHMLRFQKILAKAPEQVLRYEWDGEPVWPVPPKLPSGERFFQAPRCVCGSERKFEMQIMPHVLMGLCPEEYALDRDLSTNSTMSAAARLVTGEGAGMDFLTALIYSCEKSCKESNEEFVYVIPSASDKETFVKIQ
jgi:hypothetical protein